MTERRLRNDALEIWRAGVGAVDAGRLVHEALRVENGSLVVGGTDGNDVLTLALDSIKRIAVVGAGKATTTMTLAVEDALGHDLLDAKQVTGWVNVPDATVRSAARVRIHGARKLPDNRPTAEGVEGSKKILEIVRSLGADDLLVVLLSGGGSALLPLPVEGVTLEEKLRVTALLQESGATIGEMNCVRKHLSQIKGGRLAEATKARVVTLIVSDVIGDAIDVIASGPTAPDPSTFADAWGVLGQHASLLHVPGSVRRHLEAGMAGRVEETPKAVSGRVTNVIIGNGLTARRASAAAARGLGWETVDIGEVCGDTGHKARYLSVLPEAAERGGLSRVCVISGGETTVDLAVKRLRYEDPVLQAGKGGRNQEFALATLAARGADGLAGVCVLCGGTDGEDGPTDAAGAVVDEELARAAMAKGLDPAEFLRRHDAYNFFEPLGGLVKTGPTNTNVMDLRVVLIDRTEGGAVPALAEPRRRSASAEARAEHLE